MFDGGSRDGEDGSSKRLPHQHENRADKKKERRRRTAFTQVDALRPDADFSSSSHALDDIPLATKGPFTDLPPSLSLTRSPVESAAVPGAEVHATEVPLGSRARLRRQDPLSLRNASQDVVSEPTDQVEETE